MGNLLLIAWDVDSAGTITRLGDSGNQAREIGLVDIVSIDDNTVVTASQDSSGRLNLIAWRVFDDGSITRLTNPAAGDFLASEVSAVALPRDPNDPNQFTSKLVTAVRDGNGKLLLTPSSRNDSHKNN